MSSGISKMAGRALGTTFSLLLLASAVQGALKVTHLARMEAMAGQNVSLPCILKDTDAKIVGVEWSLRGTKLVLYMPFYGTHYFWSNITLRIAHDEKNQPMGTYLELGEAQAKDSGVYICDITAFPYGSVRSETELQIKDFTVTCDADAVEVDAGENVTVRCSTNSTATGYMWTKNKELVSESASLELWRVTGAHAGVYTLTVSAGEATLRKEVVITVRTTTPTTTTTQPVTDAVTVSPQTDATTESLSTPADRDLTSLATTMASTADSSPTFTFVESDNVTDEGPSRSNATATPDSSSTPSGGGDATATPSTADSSPTPPFVVGDNVTDGATAMWETTEERGIMGNSTSSLGETSSVGTDNKNAGNTGGRPGLVFIIVPVLILIVVAAVLYRRQIIKQRMDLPPPFKPPPPPIKYTAARQRDDQDFPVSRCNSAAV